jgi:uncharacterized membrane protein
VKQFRRYLVAGLLVWMPLGATLILVRFAVGQMDRSISLLPHEYQPGVMLQNWLGTENPVEIPGFGVILIFIVVLLTGVLVANFVGRAFVGGWESLLDRIPVVRAIYSAAKNFAEIVFSDSSQSFKKVLLIEYPRKGLYSLAFQTSNKLGEIEDRTGEDVVCCFVPTTPNPTSGFIVVIPKKDIVELEMTVDEALKMIISLGVVVPLWSKDGTAELPFDLPASTGRPGD